MCDAFVVVSLSGGGGGGPPLVQHRFTALYTRYFELMFFYSSLHYKMTLDVLDQTLLGRGPEKHVPNASASVPPARERDNCCPVWWSLELANQ